MGIQLICQQKNEYLKRFNRVAILVTAALF